MWSALNHAVQLAFQPVIAAVQFWWRGTPEQKALAMLILIAFFLSVGVIIREVLWRCRQARYTRETED